MKFYCIERNIKYGLRNCCIAFFKSNIFKIIRSAFIFSVTFVSWYFLGMSEFYSFNEEHKLLPTIKEYFIWSIESGDWFHYCLISIMFGVLSVIIFNWVIRNWKYWSSLFYSCDKEYK